MLWRFVGYPELRLSDGQLRDHGPIRSLNLEQFPRAKGRFIELDGPRSASHREHRSERWLLDFLAHNLPLHGVKRLRLSKLTGSFAHPPIHPVIHGFVPKLGILRL